MSKVGEAVSDDNRVRTKLSIPNTSNPQIEREIFTLNRLLTAVFANMSGLIIGYTMCSISVAMPILKDIWKMKDSEQSYIIGIVSVGAAVFSLASGGLNDLLGRRAMIISSSFLIMSGDIATMAMGKRKKLISVARLISGFGVGLSSATVPAYVSECAPRRHRGRCSVLFQLSIALGYLLAACVASLMDIEKFGISGLLMLNVIFSVIQFIGMIVMPESPRWLILRGHYNQAYKVMTWMQSSSDESFEELAYAIRKEGHHDSDVDNCTIFYIVRNTFILRALIIGCVLQFLKQMTFMRTLFFYGSGFFVIIRESPQSSILVMTVLFGVNFLFTLLAFIVVSKFKRRTLLLLSLACFAVISLIAEVGYLRDWSKTSYSGSKPPENYKGNTCAAANCLDCAYQDDCGFCFIENQNATVKGQCLPTSTSGKGSRYGNCKVGQMKPDYQWSYGRCKVSMLSTYIILVQYIVEIAAFAIGIGPLAWTVNAEIFPTWARSTSVAFTAMIFWSFDAFFNMTYYSLRPYFDDMVKAWISFIFCVLGIIFIIASFPKTKGRRLEDCDKFLKPKWNFYFFKI